MKKRNGNRNVTREPKINDIPNNIVTILKYMGCLLILKGPVITRDDGTLKGFSVVLCCLNSLSAQISRKNPKTRNKMPK
jgi:hypothetical protein